MCLIPLQSWVPDPIAELLHLVNNFVKGSDPSIEYTLNGKLSKLSTPYGDTSYEYDKMDRIVRVVDHNGNVTLYSYDKIGNRETLTYSNGLQAKYKYDVNSNLTNINIVDSKTNVIKSYAYKRNKNGYPVSIEETDNNGTKITSYEYDAVNRLVSENIKDDKGSIGYKYSFDKVGNRTSKTVNVSGTISGLTDNVSVVKTGTTKYTYNDNNQLITETYNNQKTVYSYDDNGNLVGIINNKLTIS